MPHDQPLKTLDPEGWFGLLEHGETHAFAAQELIFADRAGAECLFVVRRGQVEILKETSPGHDMRLALLEPDSLFGAGCIFDRESRSAKARAFEEAEVLAIPAREVQAYLEASTQFAMVFYRHLARTQHRIIANLDLELAQAYSRLEQTV